VPTVTGEQKAFIADVEERIQVLQTEAQKLREGSYAFEQYQAAQQTKGEIDKLVEDAKELGVNVDDLARRLKAAADARQATEAELARSAFRDELERTIAGLDQETQAILAGTGAYEEYQKAREIDEAVADFTAEAEGLGLVRGEVERLTAEYRAAAKARQDALTQEARREFQEDFDKQLAAMDDEIVALGQGSKAYEDYQKKRAIDRQVDAIVEQKRALGEEEDAALAAGEAYRRRAEAINAGLEQLEEAKEREEEAKRLARELAAEFTRTASSMIVEARDTEEALDGLIKSLQELALQVFALKPVEDALTGVFSGMLSQTGSGTGTSGNFFGAVGGLFHGGGKVGSTPVSGRVVPASLFAGAPRFHQGMGDDEFAAILRRGERVLTEDLDHRAQRTMQGLSDQASRPRGGTVVNYHVTTPDADSFKRSQRQILTRTQTALNRAHLRDG
jgi:hypothetical protein